MSTYLVSPQANADIFDIWQYIAENSDIATADRVREKFYAAFETLSKTPGQGHGRSDLTSYPLLFFPVYSYLIVYRLKSSIEIVAVLHGRRDVERLLRQRLF